MTSWVSINGQITAQDCLTTRTDLSDRQCQTNRKGLVSCVCSTDMCNVDTFSIPTDIVLTAPPTIKCYNKFVDDDNFCFGQFCRYSRQLVPNDFGDVQISSFFPERGCSDLEYNHDLASMNVCYTNDEMIVCQCNTEFCNKDQPFDVPMGNLLCYYNSNGKPGNIPGMKYCRGHLCYVHTNYDIISRGCINVSDGGPEELKKKGGYLLYRFCDEDLCNGEITADPVVNVEGSGNLS
ncbi:DUF7622 domain-containing protein [Caenorhabditis elegans]|nr:Activin_recp domain-containing protein [Caenorhabditis elegans]CTQ86801.1 Activin_recp domain-containing protein [Caenorhabditis elegans]|eukprot:NP_001300102.1 Uncharacterized protein CELE_F36H9.2 [Caenorhabditis elegans]